MNENSENTNWWENLIYAALFFYCSYFIITSGLGDENVTGSPKKKILFAIAKLIDQWGMKWVLVVIFTGLGLYNLYLIFKRFQTR